MGVLPNKPMPIDAHIIDPRNLRDLATDLLDADGKLKVVPSSYFAATSREERAVFCAKNALYGLLTNELVAFVKSLIEGRRAIEIGAGHGGLAAALDIHATDNWMQAEPAIQEHYRSIGVSTIQYGKNVEKLDALEAVQRYKPEVVVASWVTHKYDEARHEAGGNMFGVVEEDIIKICETYLFIGNDHVHKDKSIWALPHVKLYPSWLYSRAMNGSRDFIAVWGKIPESMPAL
ncbi:hypothetical protein F6X40_09765 [Paraburkholderia sp. UCT31]|uniref:hypothetical protein n=1 Tax=Paraburkholderia sp. UCT31 TaxID=2615209 RepID=UPI001655576F|nr:hypothetical protein [Paraburkholderia sp. UCT31]MBC8737094.1 hypothetical protein [Paraburkholderia sp. UCT31]